MPSAEPYDWKPHAAFTVIEPGHESFAGLPLVRAVLTAWHTYQWRCTDDDVDVLIAALEACDTQQDIPFDLFNLLTPNGRRWRAVFTRTLLRTMRAYRTRRQRARCGRVACGVQGAGVGVSK
jgi:hypothetical protein